MYITNDSMDQVDPDDILNDFALGRLEWRNEVIQKINGDFGFKLDNLRWIGMRNKINVYPFLIYYLQEFLCRHSEALSNPEIFQAVGNFHLQIWKWHSWEDIEALCRYADVEEVILALIKQLPLDSIKVPTSHNEWTAVFEAAVEQDLEDISYTIMSILSPRTHNGLLDLHGDALRNIMNLVQILIDNRCSGYRRLERFLNRLVRRTGVLPPCLIVNGVSRIGATPIAAGGFADVWRGRVRGSVVALKVLRIFGKIEDGSMAYSEFWDEAVVWRTLNHDNICPFYGICLDVFKPRLALVSPWMPNGDMLQYVKMNPEVNRMSLLTQVAKGLCYLHEFRPRVVHADLKAVNILIDASGQPRITDFGLAKVIDSDASTPPVGSFAGKGSMRWQAPELLHPGNHLVRGPTIKSDVYAYACVCLEIFTGKVPWFNMSDGQVIEEVCVHGRRPPRPLEPAMQMGLDDVMWDLMQACWDKEPVDRPVMKDVVTSLVPKYGSDAEVNTDDRISIRDPLLLFLRDNRSERLEQSESQEEHPLQLGTNPSIDEKEPANVTENAADAQLVHELGSTSDIGICWNPDLRTEIKSRIDSRFALISNESGWNIVRDQMKVYPFTVHYIQEFERRYPINMNLSMKQRFVTFLEDFEQWRSWGLIQALVDCGEIEQIVSMMTGQLIELIPTITSSDPSAEKWIKVFPVALEQDIDDVSRTLVQILSSSSIRDRIFLLNREHLCKVLNIIQGLIDSQCTNHRFLDWYLFKLVKKRNVLPPNLLVHGVYGVGKNPVEGGGFADVYKGKINGKKVALKVLRVSGRREENEKALKEFRKEAMVWRLFMHPHVCPFLGICMDVFAPRFALVTPWMEDGTLMMHLSRSPSVDRKKMLSEVALGLCYLHSFRPRVIHGDVKAVNVLVDASGKARIADFGVSRVIYSQATTMEPSASSGKGTMKWQAPELLKAKRCEEGVANSTTQSDVYAYGCLCLEVFTEQVPWAGYTEGAVINAVVYQNQRPPRPSASEPAARRGLDDAMWALMQDCWEMDPEKRPGMKTVVDRLIPGYVWGRQMEDRVDLQDPFRLSISVIPET